MCSILLATSENGEPDSGFAFLRLFFWHYFFDCIKTWANMFRTERGVRPRQAAPRLHLTYYEWCARPALNDVYVMQPLPTVGPGRGATILMYLSIHLFIEFFIA